jgi:hypothetical protein
LKAQIKSGRGPAEVKYLTSKKWDEELLNHVEPLNQWPFQDPRLEVPTIYKAFVWGLCKGISPVNMARNMVQYLHFRILEFPFIWGHQKSTEIPQIAQGVRQPVSSVTSKRAKA